MARRPAAAPVTNEVATTVRVIAGMRCDVGIHSSLRRRGPGPSGKTTSKINPHMIGACRLNTPQPEAELAEVGRVPPKDP